MKKIRMIFQKKYLPLIIVMIALFIGVYGIYTYQQVQTKWQNIAHDAAMAGEQYAKTCAKTSGIEWTKLTPALDCRGNISQGQKNVYASGKGWQATYEVKAAKFNHSEKKARFQVVGTVKTFADASYITKIFTSENSIILNVDEISTAIMEPFETNGTGLCILNATGQLRCKQIFNASTNVLELFNTGTEKVIAYEPLYYLDLSALAVCALTDAQNVWCAGVNTNHQFLDSQSGAYVVPLTAPVKLQKAGGVDVKAKALWTGVNISGNVCVLGTDDVMYCTGGNVMGVYGNGTANTTGNIEDPNTFGSAIAQPSFSTGDFATGVKVKKIYGHLTYSPFNSISIDDFDYTELIRPDPPRTYGVNWKRCVVGTNDQLYCAGVCSERYGGILFGNSLYGSGIKGCGVTGSPTGATAYSPAPNLSGGNTTWCSGWWQGHYVPPPPVTIDGVGFVIGTRCGGHLCYSGSQDGTAWADTKDPKARCYYTPVKFQLPAGVKVKETEIGWGANSGSKLCVFGTDKNIYCTFSAGDNPSFMRVSEPRDINTMYKYPAS